MKEFTIKSNEANQRFDKYLKKLLPNASTSFIYKMLRKKNITCNGKKATGNESLSEGDVIRLFLSDETFDKFSMAERVLKAQFQDLETLKLKGIKVIFEDENILIVNKPANMLSQKAVETDISANERLIGYLIQKKALSFEDYKTFRPSVCNRLDRNTTGLLLMGKSLQGLQELSAMLKDRTALKYYYAVVSGRVEKEQHLKGYLTKDEASNRVSIVSEVDEEQEKDYSVIETAYKPLKVMEDCSLLEVHLITGKTHQIRAHLSSIGHPIIGDLKYGDSRVNEYYKREFKVSHQLLHAQRIVLGEDTYEAPLPAIYERILGEI